MVALGIVNNPCLAAAIEAIEYIGGFKTELAAKNGADISWFTNEEVKKWQEFRDNVILVSLGTGYSLSVLDNVRVDKNIFIDWMRYVISAGMDDASLDQVLKTRAIYGTTQYDENNPPIIDFRRYNPWLTYKNVEETLEVDLTGRKVKPEDLALDSFSDDAIQLMFDIGKNYARKICWSQGNVMPWDRVEWGGHKLPKHIAEDAKIPLLDHPGLHELYS